MTRALYNIEEIRRIEQTALASLPAGTLMQRAGQSAARHGLGMLHQSDRDLRRPILILVGPGNNGGDALETSLHFAAIGLPVVAMFDGDVERIREEARASFQRAQAASGITITAIDCDHIAATDWAMVVDGLFGIGLTRPLQGAHAEAARAVNALRCPVLALDVPSGLNADTGNVIGGAEAVAIRATHTVTFIADKPGLHTGDGRDYAGDVGVATLDIDRQAFPDGRVLLNDVALFSHRLMARRENSRKGSYGDVVLLGGAEGMVGAAILSARAAARSGAGRVFVASPDTVLVCDELQPEIMFRSASTVELGRAVVAAGPGLGDSRRARSLLLKAIAASTPLVLDADALNMLAAEPALQKKLRARTGATVITPHPLEAARLLNISVQQVQTDRLATANALSRQLNAVSVLKGSGTVIAAPTGETVVNGTGNAALATAGAGDVLTGACAALLAQGWSAKDAALGSVWIHGKAADNIVADGIGPIGVTAGELIPYIRATLNSIVSAHSSRTKRDVPPRS